MQGDALSGAGSIEGLDMPGVKANDLEFNASEILTFVQRVRRGQRLDRIEFFQASHCDLCSRVLSHLMWA